MARMAHAVGVSPERLESEGKNQEAAEILREIIRQDEEGPTPEPPAESASPASRLLREIDEGFSEADLEPYIRGIWREIADAVAEYGPEPSGEQIFDGEYEAAAWNAPTWSHTSTIRMLAMFRRFRDLNRARIAAESAEAGLPRRHIAAEYHLSAPADPIAVA